MADIVLVHGTTQTAAGFWRLTAALAERGHRPLTVELPGTGTDTSLECAERLADQLPHDLHRPVVAAHSASGLLLPAVAWRLDAGCQVWMAAAVADYAGGRSLLSEIRADPGALFHDGWVGVDPTTDRAVATYFLFHDADLATLQEALPTVAACDLSAVYAETPPVDPADRSSVYLLPVGDRTLTGDGMRRMARDRLHVQPVEAPGGHNNYVAHPKRSPMPSTKPPAAPVRIHSPSARHLSCGSPCETARARALPHSEGLAGSLCRRGRRIGGAQVDVVNL